ncbi:RNA polymerase II subunit A [Baffinella frigidus]|nr:RNA polymerase II subunit A [Cryptophyta sp. CCMP2293]|mmetsp:Transcript_34799/g.82510  ORF Transcript_34799/g.82510 Transcript_34799/m.82510 type:complete len:194 (+) Transcript_34799:262-843(+)
MGWRYATVCSSNMNRSMEAHFQLQKRGLSVRSFGTGSNVRLPGPSQDRPNVYEFGTPYSDIREDLTKKDEKLYTNNGLLGMLNRNVTVKLAPERWHDMDKSNPFDVVLTYEERVFDAVIQELQSRATTTFYPVHVINIETRDNHEESVISAQLTCSLCQDVEAAGDLQAQLAGLIGAFHDKTQRAVLYSLVYV